MLLLLNIANFLKATLVSVLVVNVFPLPVFTSYVKVNVLNTTSVFVAPLNIVVGVVSAPYLKFKLDIPGGITKSAKLNCFSAVPS